jgi:hypothetical protein
LVADCNTPQKQAWRAEIVLFTADRLGTNEITRRTAKLKTCVWRWQERVASLGVRSRWRFARQDAAATPSFYHAKRVGWLTKALQDQGKSLPP